MKTCARWVFLFSLSVYVATTGGSMATDTMSYEVTKGMVEHASVAMSYNVHKMEAHRGVDGRYYSPYGVGHPLYGIPFYVAGRAAETVLGRSPGKPETLRKAAFVVGSAVASALLVWLVCLFGWQLVGDPFAAIVTALAVGFGTLVWPYAKYGFNAPLAALSVLGATYATWVGVRQERDLSVMLGGLCVGAALLVRQELALIAAPLGLWLAFESREHLPRLVRRALLFSTPVLLAVVATLVYNEVRFGNPLDTGYLRDGTATFGSVLDGTVGLLISPGRSAFLYSPLLIGGLIALPRLAKADRSTAVLFAGESAVLFLFYASLEYWEADRSYGPRYLLPLLPLLCLPLAFLLRDRGRISRPLGALMVVSVLVQLPGVLVDFSKAGYTAEVGYHSLAERRWQWDVAGLTLNARALPRVLSSNARYLLGSDTPPAITPGQAETTDFSDQFAFSPDLWWIYLFYLHVWSARDALATGALLFALSGFLAWRLKCAGTGSGRPSTV